MPKLTDTQLVILSAAAGRDDGAVLPVPKSLDQNKGSVAKALSSLLNKGLVEERPAKRGAEIWRESDAEGRLTLTITPEGLAVLGIEPERPSTKAPSHASAKSGRPARKTGQRTKARTAAKEPPLKRRPDTKQEMMIDLLRRKQGATVAELSAATGWQAHSVRGAMSGNLRKKLGLSIASALEEGRGRVYRLDRRG